MNLSQDQSLAKVYDISAGFEPNITTGWSLYQDMSFLGVGAPLWDYPIDLPPHLIPDLAGMASAYYETVANTVTKNNVLPSGDQHTAGNTVPCSLAFKLVIQCNNKGFDLVELDIRLRDGYRAARNPMEGCSIDNSVLLAVLADVAGMP
jgi:hypothetical protein